MRQVDETDVTVASHVGSNVTSNTTTQSAMTSTTATVAKTAGVVGNASFGLAVVYAASVTASGFNGIYTCIGRFNDSELPLYTILQYSLTVGESMTSSSSSSSSSSAAAAAAAAAALTRSNYVTVTYID